jgi:uncharacterized membrane protein
MADEHTATASTVSKAEIEKHKVNGILCYLGILIIIPFVNDEAKKSAYVKFHLNQGLVLLLAWIVSGAVIWIPIVGWLLGIALFVIWIMAIVGAAQGEMKRVPLIGNIELLK